MWVCGGGSMVQMFPYTPEMLSEWVYRGVKLIVLGSMRSSCKAKLIEALGCGLRGVLCLLAYVPVCLVTVSV